MSDLSSWLTIKVDGGAVIFNAIHWAGNGETADLWSWGGDERVSKIELFVEASWVFHNAKINDKNPVTSGYLADEWTRWWFDSKE